MKILRNEKGFVWIWVLLFLFVIFGAGIFGAEEERIVLAGEIESGSLVETPKTSEMLSDVDVVLDRLRKKAKTSGMHANCWVSLFWAKVQLERARLEMEIEANRKK